MDAILEALHLDPHTMLLQAVNLIIVIGGLYYLLYKPIGKVIADRENKIANSLEEAKKSKNEAQALLKQYEVQIKSAKTDAQEIVSKANKLGEELQEKIISEARVEANRQLEKAKVEIQGEKNKALSEIKSEVSEMVVSAAGKVIEREISAKDHKKLLQNFVEEVGELQ